MSEYYLKAIILIINFMFTFAFLGFSEEVKIHIKIDAPGDTPKDNLLYIAGNDSSMGNWNPGVIQLEKTNESTWEKELTLK